MRVIDTRRIEFKYARKDILGPAMRTLRASPVILVPAQGPNTFIEFVHAFVSFAYAPDATVYTTGANDMYVRVWDQGTGAWGDGTGYTFSRLIDASDVIDGAFSQCKMLEPEAQSALHDHPASGLVNKPLVLDNTGGSEYTGNDENTSIFSIDVIYRVHPMHGTPTTDRDWA